VNLFIKYHVVILKMQEEPINLRKDLDLVSSDFTNLLIYLVQV